MSERFDPRRRLVVVDAMLRGQLQPLSVRLMVDTGSLLTMVRPGHLESIGYDLAAPRSILAMRPRRARLQRRTLSEQNAHPPAA